MKNSRRIHEIAPIKKQYEQLIKLGKNNILKYIVNTSPHLLQISKIIAVKALKMFLKTIKILI